VTDASAIVRTSVAPLAAAAGLDLLDVQVKGSGPRTMVKVIVDKKGGVGLAECQALSRSLSATLDETDPIDSRYQLEVSSPGVTHPLRSQRDFDRVEGRLVVVRRREGEASSEVKGTVVQALPAEVVLDLSGDRVAVPYDQIDSATQALPW
jgi:ribosome maturation factor RimP